MEQFGNQGEIEVKSLFSVVTTEFIYQFIQIF